MGRYSHSCIVCRPLSCRYPAILPLCLSYGDIIQDNPRLQVDKDLGGLWKKKFTFSGILLIMPGNVFIESMGAIIFYELVYFIFLFHTKPIPLQKYTINRDVEICIFRQWKQRELLSSVF